LRNMSKETNDILTNKNVIAVDQDSLGIEAFKYSGHDSLEVWCKPLEKGDWAVCFLNRSIIPEKILFNWKDENIADSLSARSTRFDQINYKIKNLWTDKYIGSTGKALNAEIPRHDVLMLRLIRNSN
jgi:alpha-galactosidase